MKKNIYIVLITIILTSCAIKLTDNKKASLKSELKEKVKTDQKSAYIQQGEYKKLTKEQWNSYKDSVFTSHNIRVEKIFNKYGFLGFDKVGKDGSNDFWVIVQHCDKFPDFQNKVLKAMDKEVKKGNANPNNYAYLYDRVESNAGRKQLFGTQVDYKVNTTVRAFPKFGLVDSVNVDKKRKEYNLGSLKDYLNQITTMHYEMNKEYYQKMGITKPYLY
jgi:hypothetical protein